ncbi:MAG: GNAT family N-acetyltransferase [Anaerolineae bacterium]|nr:GNAT family N-acetyltransferase [Anaerolineae bacterium]
MIARGPLTGQRTVCEPILRALPEWFGIEEATQAYAEQTDDLPTFVAAQDERPVGFLTLRLHSAYAAEISVMGVIPSEQRRGAGRALIVAAETYLRGAGICFLQVKTLSPTHPDPNYARTREFYFAMGFRPLEEFPELWDKANPCLQMIKCLYPHGSGTERSQIRSLSRSTYSRHRPG